jgi:hypothetical protein
MKMTDLVVLQRSDGDLMYFASCPHEGAAALASMLSAHHAFSVNLVACFPGLGGAVEAVRERLATMHVSNGWFATSSQIAVCTAAAALDIHETVAKKTLPETLLEVCPREHAPVASVIKRALKHKLGAETAKQALRGYRERALRTGGVCKRFLVDIDGSAMQLAR